MKILVTGAAGYIGTKLVSELKKNKSYQIDCIDNLMYNQWYSVYHVFQSPNVKFSKLGIENLIHLEYYTHNHLSNYDVIFPLAAYVGAPLCEREPNRSKLANVDQIKTIVDNITDKTLLIFPNSNSGLGQVEGIADENTPRNAVSLYGRQKDEAEDIVRTHKNSVVFRLATLFGLSYRNRVDLLVNNLVYRALFYGKITVFDPHFKRNFVHIDDVVFAFLFAMENVDKMRGEAYNLGNDACNMTKLQLAKLIGERLSANIHIGDGNDPDKRDYNVSSAKLNDAGFYCFRDLQYGIEQMIYYYKHLPANPDIKNLLLSSQRNY